MKKLIFSTLLIGMFLVIGTSKSQAEVYLGEFCWQAASTVTPKSVVFIMGVYGKEGGHYTLYGKVLQDHNTAIHGNAEIDESNVLITFVESGDINNFWPGTEGMIWNAVLNVSTLNGIYSSLELIPQQNVVEDKGTMTSITCP